MYVCMYVWCSFFEYCIVYVCLFLWLCSAAGEDPPTCLFEHCYTVLFRWDFLLKELPISENKAMAETLLIQILDIWRHWVCDILLYCIQYWDLNLQHQQLKRDHFGVLPFFWIKTFHKIQHPKCVWFTSFNCWSYLLTPAMKSCFHLSTCLRDVTPFHQGIVMRIFKCHYIPPIHCVLQPIEICFCKATLTHKNGNTVKSYLFDHSLLY